MASPEPTWEENRSRWRELAAGSNPILALLDERFGRPLDERARGQLLELPASPMPQPERSAKRYYAYAGRLMSVAWAAADLHSSHRDRPDLVRLAVELLERSLAGLDDEGFWARRGIGDPNTNRFVLMRVLEAARLLKQTAEGERRWPDWQEPLRRAVEQQRRALAGDPVLLEWDYGARKLGHYANVDLAFTIVMALSAELFGDEEDGHAAGRLMAQVAGSLLPDGGFPYSERRNESARYHTAEVCFLGRYLTLTGDPRARHTLERTVDYYPLSLTAEATPELWSAPWWKQHFVKQNDDPQHPAGLIVAAGATGDARNCWLMWRALERTEPALPDDGLLWLYAADYWPGLDRAMAAPPASWFLPDRNILGFRGRRRNWYYGQTQRRGLRNTFVGAVLTEPQSARVLAAAVRGVQVQVQPEDGPELWLSGESDPVAVAQDRIDAAVVGACCGLQPSRYGDSAGEEPASSPWHAVQVSYVSGAGLLVVVRLCAAADAGAVTAAGRVLLGPEPPERVGEGAFVCGPLQALVLDASTEPCAGRWGLNDDDAWPCLEFVQALDQPVCAGDEVLRLAVWLAPVSETPPSSCAQIAATAWRAGWEDREIVAGFNPGAAALDLALPVDVLARRVQGWTGEDGTPVQLQPCGTLRIPAGACVLVRAE